MGKQLATCVGLLALSIGCAHAQADSLSSWIGSETSLATTYMLRNVSPAGTAPGVVIASPSQTNPNYYYHWVRDAAITMDAVVNLYATTGQSRYYNLLLDYVNFSRGNQLTPNPSGDITNTGLGEPKFNVDGSAFTSPWGRPQNDGPALRALTLIHFAEVLIAQGQISYVQSKLYSATIPANTVIKADLEYVSHHWQDPSFDLWEEVEGTHFFTRAVQRKAMLKGAEIANELGDSGAAAWYQTQADAIAASLDDHWNGNYIGETLGNAGVQAKGKTSNLDGGVIIGALIGAPDHCAPSDFPCSTNDRVLATAYHLQQAFQSIYPINRQRALSTGEALGTAIGRYPEDVYDGVSTNGQGNPWFILTNTFAELCYRASSGFEAAGQIQITDLNRAFLQSTNPKGVSIASIPSGARISSSDSRFVLIVQALHDAGDAYMRRVKIHVDTQGAMSEQMNRSTGFMQSAHDLTWSYGSFLTASWAR